MLSPKLLEALREHWRGLQHKPSAWLFPGNRWHSGDKPITTKVVWDACKEAARERPQLGLVVFFGAVSGEILAFVAGTEFWRATGEVIHLGGWLQDIESFAFTSWYESAT